MAKLSINDKIEIYEKRQKGKTISNICREYSLDRSTVKYLILLIKKHGYDILKKKKICRYSEEVKNEAINRVLVNKEPIKTVAIDLGLSSGATLRNWIKN